MEETEDHRLVRRCRTGDRAAFGALVEKYQGPVYRLALKMTHSPSDAEDISQAAFLKAYENLGSYDGSHKFFSWLYRIALNEALNHLKYRERFQEIPPGTPDGEPSQPEQMEKDEHASTVQQALMELKPEYRSVIVLSHFEELSYEEIADVLRIPVRKVKSRLYSARQLLRIALLHRGVRTDD